jgi:hypothetical protein
MALHRDIFWIGRQWAVTGHGMQLIDQRLEGAFDIEAIKLWDDDLIESMRSKKWLNAADFDKGLEAARMRHPRPAPGAVTAQVLAVEPITPPPLAATPEAPKLETSKLTQPTAVDPPHAAAPQAPESPPLASIEPPKLPSPDLQMKIQGHARFVRPWRVWMKQKT